MFVAVEPGAIVLGVESGQADYAISLPDTDPQVVDLRPDQSAVQWQPIVLRKGASYRFTVDRFPAEIRTVTGEVYSIDQSGRGEQPGPWARTLTGHERGVRSVAVLPDGRRALSGSEDQTIRLWDLASGEEVRRFGGSLGMVLSVAALPDGRHALSGSFDRMMRLWDLETGVELHRFEGHTDWVEAVAALPDRRRALSASGDRTIRLWDLQSGAELLRLEGHTGTVASVVGLPDSSRALSGSHDSTARLWDLEKGVELRRFEGHQAGVNFVAVVPDGRRALSGSADWTIRRWDLETGAELGRFEGHTTPITSVVVLADGRRALSGSEDGTLRLWDLEAGIGLRTFEGQAGGIGSLAVLPSSQQVLCGLSDGSLRLWDIGDSEKPRAKPIVLPYASLGSLFKGHEAFPRRLRGSLTRDRGDAAAIVSTAISGMGGTGKTRAAVEYAWAYREDYTALLFAQAASPEELRRNLAGLAGPLLLPEREAAEEDVRFNAVVAWLGANAGWLLILDGVDVPPALAEANRLMGRLTGGHVLLTSRIGADSFPWPVEPLEVDVLSQDAAVAFLLEATEARRHKAADDDAAAIELAEELGGLAVALEQAAATIEKLRCGFRRYLEIWQSNRERVVGWVRPEIIGYHHAVAATWQTSVDQLTEAGRHLLERLAFFAPDPVPMFLLDVAVPGAESEDLHEAVADLTAVSLATRNAENERFAVHRLMQDVTRRSLDASPGQRPAEALAWVDAAFTGDPQDVRSWPHLDPLAPHARSVTQWADAAGITGPTARLMSQLALLLYTKALYGEAEPLLRRALAIDESSLGPDHPDVARDLNNLIELLRATNRLAEAEPLARRALAIAEANFGPAHPTVAGSLNNLAQLLQATNRLAEAEPLMRRALAMDEARFGPDHPTVARDLNNLALLLQVTNRLAEVEPLMRRALVIDEASFGPDHPTVARDLNNFAELLRATNRLAEAEPLYRRALAIDEASFGAGHPTVASRLSNLAELLGVSSRPNEAEPLMRRALAIDEASLGADHPTVAIDLSNLALLLQATNRLAEAEPLMRRALAIFVDFERKTGHPHPHPHPHRDLVLRNYADMLGADGQGRGRDQSGARQPGGRGR
jgi:WD40 repeat protein/tetratricopeptide (TPR) repeat protein